MAVLGMNGDQKNFFNPNSAGLAQAMATCKKLATNSNLQLNTWRQKFFSENAVTKKTQLT